MRRSEDKGNRKRLCDLIQEALDKRDMSRAQLARELGYNEITYSEYVAGRSKFSQPALKKTAEFLELPKKQAIKLAGYDFYEEKRIETLTDLIQSVLDKRDMSRAQLARKLGYNEMTYSGYVAGRSKFPQQALKKTAEYLNLPKKQAVRLAGYNFYKDKKIETLTDLIQSALDEKGMSRSQLARE